MLWWFSAKGSSLPYQDICNVGMFLGITGTKWAEAKDIASHSGNHSLALSHKDLWD